jgi:hypothetical protein
MSLLELNAFIDSDVAYEAETDGIAVLLKWFCAMEQSPKMSVAAITAPTRKICTKFGVRIWSRQ